ncbi:MAG: hypothetical protein ACXABO_03975 [Promethearchaeota archaeon]|jgi:hypothetical protein
MGVIMITVWYPPSKAIDIAKIYAKQPREIPFVTKWRAFNTSDGTNGMKQYHLIYTERGKLEEASKELNKYFMPFIEIEGFFTKSETLMGVSESFDIVGLKW